ncbi:MAG: methionine--tRNA ligase, partial [Planctomycetota bacterium]
MADSASTTSSTPPPTQEQATAAKPIVAFDDFARLDLRVARVVQAREHPNADRLLVLDLDDGSGEPRTICAGVKGHYSPEELEGRLIVIVANLAPRTIRGVESRGMLLAASD